MLEDQFRRLWVKMFFRLQIRRLVDESDVSAGEKAQILDAVRLASTEEYITSLGGQWEMDEEDRIRWINWITLEKRERSQKIHRAGESDPSYVLDKFTLTPEVRADISAEVTDRALAFFNEVAVAEARQPAA